MGTVIIVKGADFSQKNLGTIALDRVKSIVETYINLTGASSYYTALYNLVDSLLNEGLWDKTLCLHPMLGTTLDALSVNLASGNKYPLSFKENAVPRTNHVYFSNTTEVSSPESVTPLIKRKAGGNLGFLVRFYRATQEVSNGSRLMTIGSAGFETTYVSSGRGVAMGILSSRKCSYQNNCVKGNYAYVSEGTNCRMYFDSELVSEQTVSESTAEVNYYGVMGCAGNYAPSATVGSTISANTNLASGEVSIFVYGDYSNADMVKVNRIISEFVNAVGK